MGKKLQEGVTEVFNPCKAERFEDSFVLGQFDYLDYFDFYFEKN